VVVQGCSTKKACETGLYDQEGKCCEEVCNKECPSGYVQGSCRCECREEGSVFGDAGGIEPPPLPQ